MTNAFVLSESCITQRSWARRISWMFILCCILWKDLSGWFTGWQFVGVFWEKMFFRSEYALAYPANRYSWSIYHARYLLERREASGAKAPHSLEIRLNSLGIAFRSCLLSFLEVRHITWPPHSTASSFVNGNSVRGRFLWGADGHTAAVLGLEEVRRCMSCSYQCSVCCVLWE